MYFWIVQELPTFNGALKCKEATTFRVLAANHGKFRGSAEEDGCSCSVSDSSCSLHISMHQCQNLWHPFSFFTIFDDARSIRSPVSSGNDLFLLFQDAMADHSVSLNLEGLHFPVLCDSTPRCMMLYSVAPFKFYLCTILDPHHSLGGILPHCLHIVNYHWQCVAVMYPSLSLVLISFYQIC